MSPAASPNAASARPARVASLRGKTATRRKSRRGAGETVGTLMPAALRTTRVHQVCRGAFGDRPPRSTMGNESGAFGSAPQPESSFERPQAGQNRNMSVRVAPQLTQERRLIDYWYGTPARVPSSPPREFP